MKYLLKERFGTIRLFHYHMYILNMYSFCQSNTTYLTLCLNKALGAVEALCLTVWLYYRNE